MLIMPGESPGERCPPAATVTLARAPVPPSVPPLLTVTGLISEPLTTRLPRLMVVGPE